MRLIPIPYGGPGRHYIINKIGIAPVVDGCSSKPEIAECFKASFQRNSVPNNKSNVEKLDLRFSVSYGKFMDKHKEACNCKSIYITMFNVIDALGNMKCGKSSDKANISAEHLHYAPLNFLK